MIFSDKHISAEQRTLCRALSATASEAEIRALAGLDSSVSRAAEMGRSNWLAPLVYHQLRDVADADLPGMVDLAAAYDSELEFYRSKRGLLSEVSREMANAGVTMAVLKGTGLAHTCYPDPVTRPAGDIDVVVTKSDFPRAVAVLRELGYQSHSHDPFGRPEEYHLRYGGQFEVSTDKFGREVPLELHWRPISGETIFGDREPTADEFIARSTSVDIGDGDEILVLAAEDNLIQNALHTSKHSYVRKPGLRMFVDIDRLVADNPELDWDHVARTVEELRVGVSVYLVIQIAVDLLGTPVPTEILSRISRALERSPARKRFLYGQLRKRGVFDAKVESFPGIERLIFHLALTESNLDAASLAFKKVLPPPDRMMVRYQLKGRWQLPYYYAYHASRVVFRQKA